MTTLRDAPSGPEAAAAAMPPGVIVVADLATLALLRQSTRVTYGSLAYVQRLKRCFELDPTATETPIPGQLVAATGGGLWRSTKIFSQAAGPWNARTDWHIDAVAGSVEGSGSAAEPLSSWMELKTRLDGQQLGAGTKVTLHTSIAEVLDFSQFVQDPTSPLEITGDPGATVLATDTVNTYTAESVVAPGEAPILLGNTIADWTPYVAKRIRFVNGAPAGAYSAVAKASPGGLGVNRARLCRPIVPVYPQGTYVTPVNGNTFVVESLPSVLGLAANSSAPGNPVILRGIAFPETALNVNATNLAIWGSTGGNLSMYVTGLNLQGCRMGNPADLTAGYRLYTIESQMRCCVLFALRSYGSRIDMRNMVGQGGMMFYGGIADIYNTGCFDATTDGMTFLRAGAFGFGSTAIYGYGNTSYGIQVSRGLAGLTYSAKPVIIGTAGNARITGVTYTWAALPAAVNTVGAGIVTP